jgi:hypothetical protein
MKEVIVVMSVVLAIFAAGCTSSPENAATAPNTTIRYVELYMADGSRVGGEYVSESAAFVTIIPMYLLDKDDYMVRGNGKEVGVKTDLVTSMRNIEDPSSLINTTIKAQSDIAAALDAAKKEQEREAEEYYRIQKEKREEERAKYMPTKPKVYTSE